MYYVCSKADNFKNRSLLPQMLSFLWKIGEAKFHLLSMSLKRWYAASKKNTMILKIMRMNYVKPSMNSIHLPIKSIDSIALHNTFQGQIPLVLLNLLNQKCLFVSIIGYMKTCINSLHF